MATTSSAKPETRRAVNRKKPHSITIRVSSSDFEQLQNAAQRKNTTVQKLAAEQIHKLSEAEYLQWSIEQCEQMAQSALETNSPEELEYWALEYARYKEKSGR